MDNNVLVSVIMLSYNHERYIERALKSVVSQKTDFEYEILIGDDASTDSSVEILRKYSLIYPQIRLFIREKNLGTTRNAYELMKTARGKYLASCESDDYWIDEYKLQKQVDFLNKHNEFIGCAHRVMCVDENGRPTYKQGLSWVTCKKIYRLRDFKGIYLPGQSGSIVRRNIFLSPKFDYSIMYKAHPYIGDRTSTMLFAAQGDFYIMSEVMSCYQQHLTDKDKSVTKRLFENNPDRISDELVYEKRLETYAKEVLNADIGAEYYRRELLVSALLQFFQNNSKGKKSLKEVIQSLEKPFFGFASIPFHILKKMFCKIYCIS